MNKDEIMSDFVKYLLASYNENVYYELKSFLSQIDIEDENYSETLDYICDNLHGSVVWDKEA